MSAEAAGVESVIVTWGESSEGQRNDRVANERM